MRRGSGSLVDFGNNVTINITATSEGLVSRLQYVARVRMTLGGAIGVQAETR